VMHTRASAKEIIWLTEGFESVTAKTGTITCPSAFFSLPLHCDASPYWLCNWVQVWHWGLITQSWSKLSILKFLFDNQCYKLHRMIQYTAKDNMKNIQSEHCHQGDTVHTPKDAYWASYHSICQTVSCFLCRYFISLSCGYRLLEV
jgi:hypothetical protein